MNMVPLKILIIEDSEEDANLIKYELQNDDIIFEAQVVMNKEDFEKGLQNFVPDAVLCDHTLPQFDSIRALKILRKTKRNIPFILVTGSVSEEFAVQMIHAGAHDYIIKDRLTRLPAALINALKRCRSENERLEIFNELVANVELFKKAEKTAHFGIWEFDLVKNETKWSDQTYRMMGYEVNEVVPSGETFLKNIHPADKKRIQEIVNTSSCMFGTVKMEFRIINKDQSESHIASEFLTEYDNEGKAVRITGFDKDITGQKTIEEEKEKIEKEYQTVNEKLLFHLENTPLGFIIWNKDLSFLSWSKRAVEIFGWDEQKFVDFFKEGYSYIHKDDLERVKNIASEMLRGENDKNSLLCRFYRKDGRMIWTEWFNSTQKDKNGNVVSIFSLVQDVTSRKNTEENLRINELKFRRFFEKAPEAIFIFDVLHGVFADVNENASRLLKYTRDEIVEKGPLDISPVNQPDGLRTELKMKQVIGKTLKGENIITELVLKDSEGKEIFCEIRPSMLYDNNSDLIRVSVIDITDRKNAENERTRITKDLFIKNQNLEQFTYIVSHNLRAPVANIIGFNEMLNSDDCNEEEKENLRTELSNSVLRLDNVIKDLNDILNLKSTVSMNKELVNFSHKLKNIKELLKDNIEINDVEILSDFSAAPEMLSVKSYMYSIFYNLISNAIKFRNPGVKPVIMISSSMQANKIRLVFKDNGLGIDLQKRGNQVFGLYKRFHPQTEGKGVGLFMVKTQVEMLGGRINIESEIDQGTTITIEFNLES